MKQTPLELPYGNFRCPAATGLSVWLPSKSSEAFLSSPKWPRESRKIVSDKTLSLSLSSCLRPTGALCSSLGSVVVIGGVGFITMTRAARPSPMRGLSTEAAPIGSVDPYALKIPARRAERNLPAKWLKSSTHRHRAFAVWLPLAPPKWPPLPPPLTCG